MVAIGFALIPASMISHIVGERKRNLKHMQVLSGMSLLSYWISNMLFDIVKAMIPSGIVIGLLYAFGFFVRYKVSFNFSMTMFGEYSYCSPLASFHSHMQQVSSLLMIMSPRLSQSFCTLPSLALAQ